MTKTQEIGRLAMRVEGDNWNAYFAQTDTMDGALFLGSIAMGAVIMNQDSSLIEKTVNVFKRHGGFCHDPTYDGSAPHLLNKAPLNDIGLSAPDQREASSTERRASAPVGGRAKHEQPGDQ